MDKVTQINHEFYKLLNSQPDAVIRDEEVIREKMLARGFTCDGNLIQTSIKPYFIEQRAFEEFSVAARVLFGMLDKVTKLYLNGYDFDGLIKVDDPLLRDLIKIDPGYASRQVIQRMDLFYDLETKEFKFNEFNCSDPSCMGWQEMLIDVFSESYIINDLKNKFDIKFYPPLNKHLQTVLNKYSEYCSRKGVSPKKNPTCAAACYKAYMMSRDVGIITEYFNKYGAKSFFTDTCEFEYNGKELTYYGEVIDIVYRDSMLDFTREDLWPKARNVMDAYRDGKVCLINSAASVIGGHKSIMSILTDPKYSHFFSQEETRVANKYIPWTRFFGGYHTDFCGRTVDMIPHVLANKDLFVLKPSVGYGGIGVVIGLETSAEEWNNVINNVLKQKEIYVVQEYIEIQHDDIPSLDVRSGKYEFVKKYVGLGLWVFDHNLASVLVRFSSDKRISVTQGGGLALACFVS